MQFYRLKESAWWTLILLQVVGCAAGIASLVGGEGSAGNARIDAVYRNPLFIALIIGARLAVLRLPALSAARLPPGVADTPK